MALTPERIRELWENYSPTQGIESFVRSVEAEVRKDDEALIRRLLEALVSPGGEHALLRERVAVVKAARARLAPPPPTA